MGGMKVNFAEVEGGFDTLPEDVYEGIIERAEMRQGESSEYPYINMEIKVTEGEHEDRRIWKGNSLSPKALGFTKDSLVNLGVIEEDDEIEFEWEDDIDIGPSEGPLLTHPELEGVACQIRTVNRVDDGKERQDAWRSEFVPADDDPKPKSSGRAKSSGGRKAGSKSSGGKRTRKLR